VHNLTCVVRTNLNLSYSVHVTLFVTFIKVLLEPMPRFTNNLWYISPFCTHKKRTTDIHTS